MPDAGHDKSPARAGNGAQAAISDVRIAAVLPCYRSRQHVLGVIARIGPEIAAIVVVDDGCPDETGRHVEAHCDDARVEVVHHQTNQGVGGAMVTGYRHALAHGADIVVKIDSDGQMDPEFVPVLLNPILLGVADYTKGNRFYDLEGVREMPLARKIGNAGLSFLSKLSGGYWNIFDPTNGFTAIHKSTLTLLPLHKLHERYFFESDMLFRLNTVGAVVVDVPMTARYGDETSNLRICDSLPSFACGHVRNLFKRIFYLYFLRDFSIASVQLIFGMAMIVLGFAVGLPNWYKALVHGQVATAGTVMLSALPIVLGFQSLLAFLSYDYSSVPRTPLQIRRHLT